MIKLGHEINITINEWSFAKSVTIFPSFVKGLETLSFAKGCVTHLSNHFLKFLEITSKKAYQVTMNFSCSFI